MRNKMLAGLIVALLVGLVLLWNPIGFAKTVTAGAPKTSAPAEAIQRPSLSPMNAAKQMSDAFVEVSKKVTPSIVMILNEEKLQNSLGDDAFRQLFGDDPFHNFFDFTPRQREQVQKTLGSGVIVSPDGYIITNNHVVDNSTRLQVTLPDGKRVPAKIIGTDPKTDLALVKVASSDLTPIRFADYANVQVGEWVLAIGSPFGEALQHTVTAGIISAKGRSNVGITDYENFLQTDAAINPGNSGGALVDLDGNLVGMNTAIISSNGSNAGVGFAIPVNLIQNVMSQLKANGKVVRGYIGVTIQDVTPEMSKSLNLGNQDGVVVSDVEKDSPGEEAGLKSYDVIISINGKPVHNNSELRNEVASLKPGSQAELGIIRNGDQKSIDVTVGEAKGERSVSGSPQERREKLGMELQNLTPQLARELGSDREHGVVVTRLLPGSMAEEAGLQEGDVIFEVNRQEIRSVREFENLMSQSENSSALLAVERQGHTLFVPLETK